MSQDLTTSKKVNFGDLLGNLLELLSARERDVLERRHGLNKSLNKKETLEKIGQDYKVTRERVRQIERDGIKKLKTKAGGKEVVDQLEEIEGTVRNFLKKYGGVMEENYLLNSLIDFYGVSQNLPQEEVDYHKKSLSFIVSQLLADKFEKVSSSDNFHETWKLKESPWELVEDIIDKIVEIVSNHGQPLKADELFKALKNSNFYAEFKTKASRVEFEKDLVDLDEAVLSYLRTSKKIKQNLYGHVGLSFWNTITPKRMNDKIYLVMQQHGKPLHFTEIAELINQAHFDHKKALPATIHNELILDKRYVLIGRGIYALKEWGYENGTVSDVISAILKKQSPLAKNEIINEVSKQRLVKKATINLALMNKDKFKKLSDKKYALVDPSI